MLRLLLISFALCSNSPAQDSPLMDLTIMVRRNAASVQEYFELPPNSEITYTYRPGERVRLFRARFSGDQFKLTGTSSLTFYDLNNKVLGTDSIRSYAQSRGTVEMFSGIQRRRATVMDKATYAVLNLEYIDETKDRSRISYTIRFRELKE